MVRRQSIAVLLRASYIQRIFFPVYVPTAPDRVEAPPSLAELKCLRRKPASARAAAPWMFGAPVMVTPARGNAANPAESSLEPPPATDVQLPREPVPFEEEVHTKKAGQRLRAEWRARAYFDVLYPLEEDVVAQTGDDDRGVVGYQVFDTTPDRQLPLSWWFVRRLVRARTIDAVFAKPYAWTPDDRRRGTPVVVRADAYPYLLEALRKTARFLPAHLRLDYFTAPRSVDDPEKLTDTAMLSDDHQRAVGVFVEAVRAGMQVLQYDDGIADPGSSAPRVAQFALVRAKQLRLAQRACAQLVQWRFNARFKQLSSLHQAPPAHRRAAVGLATFPSPTGGRGGGAV